MNFLSIAEWQSLAGSDQAAWIQAVEAATALCIENTDTAVVSADRSAGLVIGSGSLCGVPYGLKDLFDLKGVPTHSSSVFPELLNAPAGADSELVERLRSLGASCAAKTQMNEFAYGLSGENPHYGDCPHPRMEGCLSGGSSSGSAHMVAAGYLPLAFGTDTGGSIRVPAAWCGLFGIRWAPGYMMRGGFPLAEQFDTMGWFTRTGEEMATVLRAWFELEQSIEQNAPTGAALLPEALLDSEVYRALSSQIERLPLKAETSVAELEGLLPECNRAFNILQSSEAYELHAGWLKTHAAIYDPLVRERLLRGEAWTEEEVIWAKSIRDKVVAWFEGYFKTNDYLVLPACPTPSIPTSMATPELRENTLRLTTPASLAGLPVLTVPVMLDSERSVGLQFIFKDVAAGVPLAILESC